MNSVAVSLFIFALVFGGALVGMALRRALPQEHLGTEAKETVRLATGLVVTMTGLVLGMLVSSAKTYYDGQKSVVAQMSSKIIQLDGLLAEYGPEIEPTRREARQFAEDAVDRIWPKEKSGLSQLRPKDNGQRIREEVNQLAPKDERQAAVKVQIASAIRDLRETYWLMYLQSEQTSMSVQLLTVVTSWLVAIFVSFGIFAPPNPTVKVTLVVGAVAVSAAIFIIMEMYSPFSGILRISPVAIRDAISQMGAD
jgi:Protein of unknown function (DUF4239)